MVMGLERNTGKIQGRPIYLNRWGYGGTARGYNNERRSRIKEWANDRMIEFEEALKAMREGKAVTRKFYDDLWIIQYWKIENGSIKGTRCDEDGWIDVYIDEYEIMENDWVLYDEENLKIIEKEVRDDN